MTDAEYRATKRRVFALAKKWQKALGLAWWKIEYAWCRDGLPPPDDGTAQHGYGIAATTCTHWQYGEASIEINLPLMQDLSDDEVERTLVHEYLHILVNETRVDSDDWKQHEERVVTNLQKAIFWLLDSDVAKTHIGAPKS